MDCHFLAHGIHFERDAIHDCCVRRCSEIYGSPFILKINDLKIVNLDELFLLKRKMKEEKINDSTKCNGCLFLTENEDYTEDEDYISYINFNHWNICNSRYIYCSEETYGGDFYYNIFPIIKNLVQSKYFRSTGEITFQGGEPTLLPEFNDLLYLFCEHNLKIRVHSSGIKHSNAIENGIKKQLVTVVISPDTAKRETYEKIKRVPAFDKVWQNIKRYSDVKISPQSVKVKIILIPGINDSIEEINLFLQKVADSGVKHIIIDVEASYAGCNKYNSPNILLLMDYIKYKCSILNINYELYDSAMHIEKHTKPINLEKKNEFEYKKEFEKLKNQYAYKNYKYSI